MRDARLLNCIKSGRIPHAILICGPAGSGRRELGRRAAALYCLSEDAPEKLSACPNYAELAGASVGVAQVRELMGAAAGGGFNGGNRAFLIADAHRMGPQSQNALLKTLEEPPAHVVFILATTEPQKLPATILSRVQRYDFGRIPSRLMVERMELALSKLDIQADAEALQMVARAAEGAMRDAFSILDMCISATTDGHMTAEIVRDVLGASDKDFLFDFAALLAANDESGVMRRIDELMRDGREPQVFLREMTQHLRALLTVKAVTQEAATILDVTDEDEKRYRAQAEQFSQSRLLRMMNGFMRAEGGLRYASTPRIGVEVAMLQACEQAKGEDAAALLERIDALEGKLQALTSALDSGKLVAAATNAKPAKAAPAASAADQPASKPEPPPAPKDEQEVWQNALHLLAKNEPPLFGLIKNGRFLGAQGDVYRVQMPLSNRFAYDCLTKQARMDKLSSVLSEVAQKPLKFMPVLESNQPAAQLDAAREEGQQSLIDAFGRDTVQIDDTEGK